MTSIDILPDDVLLKYIDSLYRRTFREIEAWQSLVHVCPRWRSLCLFITTSPETAPLLYSQRETPARGTRWRFWPVLPLLIQGHIPETSDVDDIVAVLEHRHRVCKIDLNVPSSQFEKVSDCDAGANPKANRFVALVI